jgi:riboflavin kinase/FMN adenylyltransferase
MQLIRGIHNLRPEHRGSVVTIGNFDGIHLGHQRVLEHIHHKAAELELASTVIVFEPQPQEFFFENPPARLARWREKALLFHRFGVDRLLTLRFDERLASLSAEEFCCRVLIDGLDARYLVVGDDFRFGRGRSGDFEFLKRFSATHDFEVIRAPSFSIDGRRVSSTWVRECLAQGDLAKARQLLGRHYSISGRVVAGNAFGREVGYRTANVELHRREVATRGIFAALVLVSDSEPIEAIAYIGKRPIVAGTRDVLEVHMFDFEANCYGAYLTVELIEKLRDDQVFDSKELLRRQIDADVRRAKAVLAAIPGASGSDRDVVNSH